MYKKYYKSWPELIAQSKKAVVLIKTPRATGSGFFISSDGLILTSAHLFNENYEEIEIQLSSNEIKKGYLFKTAMPPLDITILKIDGNSYNFLKISDSNNCIEGEEVMAIGAPMALSETTTKGIISKCNRELDEETKEIKYIQTDTAISPGNSGGPLINGKGEVVGLMTFKVGAKGSEGLSFAIASNVVKDFRDGKLVKLEETLREKNEQRKKKEEEARKELFKTADNLHYILRSIWVNEFTSYYSQIEWMVAKRVISVQQGKAMLSKSTLPPNGFTSIDDWLWSLTVRILKKEISPSEARQVIKGSFTI